jgi:hypothetical protein
MHINSDVETCWEGMRASVCVRTSSISGPFPFHADMGLETPLQESVERLAWLFPRLWLICSGNYRGQNGTFMRKPVDQVSFL